MPFAAGLIHRFGSRDVCVGSGIVLCCLVPWLVVVKGVIPFAIILFVYGVFAGQLDVAMNSHSVEVQNLLDRPVLSAIHGWYSIGGFAGGAGASLAAAILSPSWAHLVVASLVQAAVLLVSFRWLLPSSIDQGHEAAPGIAIPRGSLAVIGLMVAFAFVSEGGMWDWTTLYYQSTRGLGAAMAAFAFSLSAGSMALSRFLGDGVVARWGQKRTIVVGASLAALGQVLAVSLPSIPGSVFCLCLGGVGIANVVPILFATAARQPGISKGYGLAAVSTCGYFAFMVGPPGIGRLSDFTGLGFALGTLAILSATVALVAPKIIAPDIAASLKTFTEP